jgi:long-chain fatty acid transport protein
MKNKLQSSSGFFTKFSFDVKTSGTPVMKKFLFIVFSFCVFLPAPALAAGFYIQEQSVSGQGAAFAGAAAEPRDASILFYNPAGMTELSGASASVGASLIMPRADFSNNGSTAGLSGGPQGAYAGGDGGNPFSPEAVPSIYAAMPVDEAKHYWIGLSVTSPFGLSDKYEPGWFGRYDSTSSDLQTIDISPVIAAKLSPELSVGGGIDIQHVDAKLESALPCPNPDLGCGAAFSAASDGADTMKGSSWATGFNAGIFWQPQETTRIGASYRSAVTQDIKGNVTITGLSGALAADNGVQSASNKLNLPNIAGLSIAQGVSDRLTLLGSYNWFGWNKFKAIDVKFDDGAPDNVTPEDFKNSYSVALGAEWKQTDELTLRTGVQYDQTPTTDAERDTRLPDSNRYWLSVGATYALNKNFSIDAAATHIFMNNANVNLADTIYGGTGAATTNLLKGSSENMINMISLQTNVKF